MKPIQEITDRVLSSVSEQHPPAEKPKPGLPAGIIDRVWERMSEIYGHRWVSSYGDCDQHGTWAKGLADMTLDELKTGFIACVKRADPWPPSLPEFRALCRPEKRENEAMYRFPPDRQLPHKLSDEARQTGRTALATLRGRLRGSVNNQEIDGGR